MVKIIIDLPDNVLVGLPPGQLSKHNERKVRHKQTSMACLLTALRRLANFDEFEVQNKKTLALFHEYKTLVAQTRSEPLLPDIVEKLCARYGENLLPDILNNEALVDAFARFKISTQYNFWASNLTIESYFRCLPTLSKLAYWQFAIIKRVLSPTFDIIDSSWHPNDGVDGLKASLREHGPHIFSGKFGRIFHDSYGRYPDEDYGNRLAYAFPKGSYKGDNNIWCHSIIVDQIKQVNGKEMVFFHDPYDESADGQSEIVYLITYDSFVQRLTDFVSRRYINHGCDNAKSFGFVSAHPEKLYENRVQPTP